MTLTGDWGKCDCTRTVHSPLNTRTEKGRHRRPVLLTPLMRPKQGRNAPGYTATKGNRWGPPCGLSTIAFVGTRLKAGKVQSVAPTQGITPPLPPDNLPTVHSRLHSLRGFRQPLAPPTSWEAIFFAKAVEKKMRSVNKRGNLLRPLNNWCSQINL